MKARRNIYLVIGGLLVIINLLVDVVALQEQDPAVNDGMFNAGYFLGSHFLLIIGLVFLRWAYKINRRLAKRSEIELEDSINIIGKEQP